MHATLPLTALIGGASDGLTTVASEKVSNTEQETLVPVIPPARDTLTTGDVAGEVAKPASSSGCTKPTDTFPTPPHVALTGDASDRATTMVSDGVMNSEQEACAPMIAPTRDTFTTRDVTG